MKNQVMLDKAAASGSILSLIHCLAVPALLTVAPFLAASFLADESFHLVMLVLIVPVSLAALFFGCRRHGDKAVIALIVAGLM